MERPDQCGDRHHAQFRGSFQGGNLLACRRQGEIRIVQLILRIQVGTHARTGNPRDRFHGGFLILREQQPILVGLPAEVGVGNGTGEHQGRSAAIRLRRMRLIHGRLHRVALLTPPVEGVAGLQAQVELVVPGKSEQLRRE